jgi:hypothetical protein
MTFGQRLNLTTSQHCLPFFRILTDLNPILSASLLSWLVGNQPRLMRMQFAPEQLQISRQPGQTHSTPGARTSSLFSPTRSQRHDPHQYPRPGPP